MSGRASSIEELIDQIDEARESESSITVDEILDAIGRRSFGPLLSVAGLIVLAPVIGDIPGMPTLMALFVALVAAQIVMGRERICLLLAAVMPLMEVVPFSANAAGLVLVMFGLALIAGDGLMVVIGSVVTVATLALIARSLLL